MEEHIKWRSCDEKETWKCKYRLALGNSVTALLFEIAQQQTAKAFTASLIFPFLVQSERFPSEERQLDP